MRASRWDLARCLVTMGRRSWGNVFETGIFRIGELICKALAFSKMENGKLMLHHRFNNLNPSEKATVSYYFGQALTKRFAEENLGVKWLLHIDDYLHQMQLHPNGRAKPKKVVGWSYKNAARPDLIGIKRSNTAHILESKGHSTGYSTGVMQHAINQVSQVISYKNRSPETRTACYFSLSSTSINGIIIDPENDEKGIRIEFDEIYALTEFYRFFVENSSLFDSDFQLSKYNFLTVPVGVPDIRFGFDERLLKLNPKELLDEELYPDYNDIRLANSNSHREFSLGLDGIVIVNG